MYDLPYHKAQSKAELVEFIERYPFATLIGTDTQNRPVATQIPLLIEEINSQIQLVGHMMKHTDHYKAFRSNDAILVLFSGHHCYVSGAWYSNPHSPSTWNYMNIQVTGSINFHDGKRLEEILRKTTLHFENGDSSSPTVYDNLPNAFKEKALPMIAGFSIEVEEIRNVFKLSQDRDLSSYNNIIEKLYDMDENSKVIATEMEKRKNGVFSET